MPFVFIFLGLVVLVRLIKWLNRLPNPGEVQAFVPYFDGDNWWFQIDPLNTRTMANGPYPSEEVARNVAQAARESMAL